MPIFIYSMDVAEDIGNHTILQVSSFSMTTNSVLSVPWNMQMENALLYLS